MCVTIDRQGALGAPLCMCVFLQYCARCVSFLCCLLHFVPCVLCTLNMTPLMCFTVDRQGVLGATLCMCVFLQYCTGCVSFLCLCPTHTKYTIVPCAQIFNDITHLMPPLMCFTVDRQGVLGGPLCVLQYCIGCVNFLIPNFLFVLQIKNTIFCHVPYALRTLNVFHC